MARADDWLSLCSDTYIAAGLDSVPVVGSGICSVQAVGGGWLCSGSRVGLIMSSSAGQMVNTLFQCTPAPTPQMLPNLPEDQHQAGMPSIFFSLSCYGLVDRPTALHRAAGAKTSTTPNTFFDLVCLIHYPDLFLCVFLLYQDQQAIRIVCEARQN